jgi:hypothetical protein
VKDRERERERERERQADGRATEKADQYEVHAQHLDAFVLDISGRQTFGVACDDEKKCIFQAAAQAQLDAPSGVLNRVRYRVKLRRDMRQGHAERMVKARRRCKSRWVRILKAQFLRNPQLDSSATTTMVSCTWIGYRSSSTMATANSKRMIGYRRGQQDHQRRSVCRLLLCFYRNNNFIF